MSLLIGNVGIITKNKGKNFKVNDFININLIERSQSDNSNDEIYFIRKSHIISPNDEFIDLNEQEIKLAEKATKTFGKKKEKKASQKELMEVGLEMKLENQTKFCCFYIFLTLLKPKYQIFQTRLLVLQLVFQGLTGMMQLVMLFISNFYLFLIRKTFMTKQKMMITRINQIWEELENDKSFSHGLLLRRYSNLVLPRCFCCFKISRKIQVHSCICFYFFNYRFDFVFKLRDINVEFVSNEEKSDKKILLLNY